MISDFPFLQRENIEMLLPDRYKDLETSPAYCADSQVARPDIPANCHAPLRPLSSDAFQVHVAMRLSLWEQDRLARYKLMRSRIFLGFPIYQQTEIRITNFKLDCT